MRFYQEVHQLLENLHLAARDIDGLRVWPEYIRRPRSQRYDYRPRFDRLNSA